MREKKIMDKQSWHYNVWKKFNTMLYKNTLTQEHIIDNGKTHHQPHFLRLLDDGNLEEWTPQLTDKKGEILPNTYLKIVKGDQYYILPSLYKDNLPLLPTETIKVRMKPSDTMIWQFISKIQTFKIIGMKHHTTLKEFIDIFNPLEHEDYRTATLMKLLSLIKRVNIGVCGEVRSGKNSNLIISKSITNNVAVKLKNNTQAKFYAMMYFNDIINIDEVTTWDKQKLNDVEDLIVDVADESPDMSKFSMDKKKFMEQMDLTKKSIIMTFNNYTENNKNLVNDKFNNFDKIEDRYPFLFVKGKVIENIRQPTDQQCMVLVTENLSEMRKICEEFIYWCENYGKHLHDWDYNKNPFKNNSRHENNTINLIRVLDVLSATQTEFDTWMDYLSQCQKDYINMVKTAKGLDTYEVEEIKM